MLIALIGGSIGDRFGPKRVLIAACLLSGASGALRGLSGNFFTLIATGFLFGLLASLVPMNAMKDQRNLVSAPAVRAGERRDLDGDGAGIHGQFDDQRDGVIALVRRLALRAGLLRRARHAVEHPLVFHTPGAGRSRPPLDMRSPSLRAMFSHVAHIKRMWLLGWAILGIGGCIQAMLGYLPLYLRDIGWTEARADSVAASFHLASMCLVIPIALWSDRLGSRRKVLIAAALMVVTGIGLLSVVDGVLVWGAVIMAGMVRDGFMAVFFTMTMETEGVGPAYAGTATGFVLVFSGVGSLIAPPLGNSLADVSPELPFVFWAGMALVGLDTASTPRKSRKSRLRPSWLCRRW